MSLPVSSPLAAYAPVLMESTRASAAMTIIDFFMGTPICQKRKHPGLGEVRLVMRNSKVSVASLEGEPSEGVLT